MSKPIVLYSHKGGPNPWKVAIILEELGLKYETKILESETEMKSKPFTDINPNGRVPAIEDHNTGLTLWESGAIIEYLIDQYDTSEKIHFKSFPEKYLCKQYLHFQVSGQGPYFGQAVWFNFRHPEKHPAVVERYVNEIRRVTMVLDNVLKGKEYLVGNKCTYADLSFLMWALNASFAAGPEHEIDFAKDYPNYQAWIARLSQRPAVTKVLEEQRKVKSA